MLLLGTLNHGVPREKNSAREQVTTVLDVKSHLDGAPLADHGAGHTLAYCFFTSGTTGKPKGVMDAGTARAMVFFCASRHG